MSLGPSPDTDRFPRRLDRGALLVGVLVAAVGAYTWLGPVRTGVGQMVALDDPRLGADPFELTITLDPRSGDATLAGLDIPAVRRGDTFPVPYGPDRGREVEIVRIHRSDGNVSIGVRCATCESLDWGRRAHTVEVWLESGRVVPGMGYAIQGSAGAGPLEVEVLGPDGASLGHRLVDARGGFAVESEECSPLGGGGTSCEYGPGFTVGDAGPYVVRLLAPQGSPGFRVMVYGWVYPNVPMRDRRSGVADAFFAAWLVLGLAVVASSLVGVPSTRVRSTVLLAVGLSVPAALWVPGASRWYWWPREPIPMGPLLAGSTVVVTAAAVWLLSRASARPATRRRRAVVLGVVALVAAAALALPALLIDDRDDLYIDVSGGQELGALVAYLSMYAATALGAVAGWLLGATSRSTRTSGSAPTGEESGPSVQR